MLICIAGVYLDPAEVVAVFPSEPEVVDCATVLMRNGHPLELDRSASAIVQRLRAVERAEKWAAEVAGA